MSEFNYISILSDRHGKDFEKTKFTYSLGDGSGQYGLDFDFDNDNSPPPDEKRMSLVIPFADGNRRDGVGDLLEVTGIDTTRHVKSPIVLFDHGKTVQLPIALATDPETGAYTVEIDPIAKQARLTAFFYQGKGIKSDGTGVVSKGQEFEHALFCEQLFDMAVKRFIRAGSVGYQVKHARELYPDYETGTPKGLHLVSILMLEGSLVVLPANGDTVRKMLAMPAIAGRPPCEYFVKSLQPYAPEKKAVVTGGFDAKASESVVPPSKLPSPSCTLSGEENKQPSDPNTHPLRLSTKELRNKYRAKALTAGQEVVWMGSNHGALMGMVKEVMGRFAVVEITGAERKADFSKVGDRVAVPVDKLGESKSLQTEEKRLDFRVFKDRTQARQFANELNQRNCQVQRFTQDGGGQWLVYWDNNCGVREEPNYYNPAEHEREGRTYRSHAGKELRQKYRQKSVSLNFTLPRRRTQGTLWQDTSGKWNWKVPLTQDHYGGYATQAEAEQGIVQIMNEKPVLGMKSKSLPADGKGTNPSRRSFTYEDVAIGGKLKPGDTVTARDYLGGGQGPPMSSGLPGPAARPGDRLEVLGWEESGSSVQLRLRNKKTGYEFMASPGMVRKGLEDGIQTKSLGDVRRKYRPVKALRHRLRKSAPGSSLVYVAGKDLKQFQAEAVAMGLKAERMGVSGDLEKIKLTGDDGAIDGVAQKFGRVKSLNAVETKAIKKREVDEAAAKYQSAMQQYGENNQVTQRAEIRYYELKTKWEEETGQKYGQVKSLNSKREKTMSDASVQTKSLEAEGAGGESHDYSKEPHGAQVLRAMHKHHLDALRDYDDMLGPLENKVVRKHIEDHLGNIEKFLGGTEKIWKKEYKELPGLEGADNPDDDEDDEETKDLTEDEAGEVADDLEDVGEELKEETEDTEPKAKDAGSMEGEAVEADSGESFPDDLVEEDKEKDEKALTTLQTKVLRGRYKALPSEEADVSPAKARQILKDGTAHGKPLTEKQRGMFGAIAGSDKKGMCSACKEAGKAECTCGKSLNGKAKGGVGEAVGAGIGAVAGGPVGAAIGGLAGDALTGKDLHHVQEAGGYLGKLAEPESEFNDEDRMKSYHYSETLKGMAQLGNAYDELESGESDIPNADFKPGEGAKDFASEEEAEGHTAPVGSEKWEEEEANEPAHKGCLMGASKFFKELSTTRDFGDPHREQAAQHAKALNDMVNSGGNEDSANDDDMAKEDVFEPGEMGEKSTGVRNGDKIQWKGQTFLIIGNPDEQAESVLAVSMQNPDDGWILHIRNRQVLDGERMKSMKSQDAEDKEEKNGKGEKALPVLLKQYKEQNQQVNGLLKTINRLAERLPV